jgi:hypothetical protein
MSKNVSVYPARLLAGEIGDQGRHIARRADEPGRDRPEARPVDACGAHRVGTDAERVELDGDGAHQADDPALAAQYGE